MMKRLPSSFVMLLVAAIYLAVALSVDNAYHQLIFTLVLVWACFGLSWNMLSGYTGLVSFGHAAFFGLGAYATVLAQIHLNLSPWIMIPVSGLIGTIAGLLVGLPTFRLRGHYFALSMLAYPLALLYVAEWLGLQEVTFPMKREDAAWYMQFSDPRAYTAIALGMLLLFVQLTRYIERSRFGMALIAIKQNEAAAEAAGIDTLRWKLKAIALSGAIAAATGAFYSVVLLVVTPPSVFGMLVSAQALTVSMFGGVGTVWGPIIGAAVLIPLGEILHAELGSTYPGIQGVILGIAIITVILLAPEGIYWKVRDRFRMRRSVLPAKVATRADNSVPDSTTSSGASPTQPVAPSTDSRSTSHDALPETISTASVMPSPEPNSTSPIIPPPVASTSSPATSLPESTLAAPTTTTTTAAPPPRELSTDVVMDVRNISKRFGGLKAVHDVSFTVRRGMILGIIGPNGAGKTTLFNLLNGFLKPDQGQVIIKGSDMAGRKPHVLCALGVGRTFQIMRPFMRLTVAQNVKVGAYVKAENDAQAEAYAAQAVQRLGLSECAHQLASTLTTRELRLMELARAVAGQPDILLLDETLAGLGHDESEDVVAAIRSLSQQGMTIVIIEHTMKAMVRLVDEFVVLDHGEVLTVGRPDAITRDKRVVEAYLGKKWSAQHAAD